MKTVGTAVKNRLLDPLGDRFLSDLFANGLRRRNLRFLSPFT